MGLASKLAAAGPPMGGAPPYPQGPGQVPGAFPGKQQYQAAPGPGGPPGQGGQYGQQPQGGQYGQQPQGGQYGQQPQGGQYGQYPQQPGQSTPADVAACKKALQKTIQEKQLQNFYPPNSPMLDQLANRGAGQVERLCKQWRLPKEIGIEVVQLGLYDVWLYIDDSGSMQFEENGERIDDLKLILQRTAFAATLFDDDGINLRFMNSAPQGVALDGIRSDQQIEQIMGSIQFRGLTPMGSELKNKVVTPILNEARSGRLRKPALVIIITDGQPAGEPQGAVNETIKQAHDEFSRMPQTGPGAIAFQFAQVGNDTKARDFLGKLDSDPVVGHLIDCTSNYEVESAEMAQVPGAPNLTPELWLVKLLLGAIDSSYDRSDEKSKPPQGYPPQQGGYQQGGYPPQQGGYPQQQQQGGYPPQQGGYPPQQQGGYPPQQGGYPPQQGGYPPQQGGYPPQQQGYPPQQQGGYPPQQGGYPPQQGGYGAPPGGRGQGGYPPPPNYR